MVRLNISTLKIFADRKQVVRIGIDGALLLQSTISSTLHLPYATTQSNISDADSYRRYLLLLQRDLSSHLHLMQQVLEFPRSSAS
jgi:hypothetical protein